MRVYISHVLACFSYICLSHCQKILSLENYVTVTKFPRKYSRSILTKRPYFLGNFVAPQEKLSRGHFCTVSVKIMEQEKYDVLLNYVRCSRFPDNPSKNEKDLLRKKSKSYAVKDGLVYHRDKKSSVERQVRSMLYCTVNYFVVAYIEAHLRQRTLVLTYGSAVQVITSCQKQQVLEGCHSNGLGGGHFG